MRQSANYRTRYIILFVFAVAGSIMTVQPERASATSSDVLLNIMSTVCVVDVVQDGAGQQLQTLSKDCEVILPNLLTSVPTQDDFTPRFALPFAGAATDPIIAQQVGSQASWSPIATTTQSSPTPQPVMRFVATMVTGIGATVIATAVAVDIAIFELRYSKSTLQWFRRRIS